MNKKRGITVRMIHKPIEKAFAPATENNETIIETAEVKEEPKVEEEVKEVIETKPEPKKKAQKKSEKAEKAELPSEDNKTKEEC
jgi:hypothetical protein